MLLCPLPFETRRFITKISLFSGATLPFSSWIFSTSFFRRRFNLIITRLWGLSLVIIVDRLDIPFVRSFGSCRIASRKFFLDAFREIKSLYVTFPSRTSDAPIFNEHTRALSRDSVCRRLYDPRLSQNSETQAGIMRTEIIWGIIRLTKNAGLSTLTRS